jgi:hypothetical protein
VDRVAQLPSFVAHADWGSAPAKRWIAAARFDGCYVAGAPEPVGEPGTLLERLRAQAGPDACVLVGFDFPIGLPARYAEATGVRDFLALLPRLGRGEWADFYEVAGVPGEVRARRPFYPKRPGGTNYRQLLDALGAARIDELRRRCELGSPPASPLFWTLGPRQVGKAAIQGWRDVLAPAVREARADIAFWPFAGRLDQLFAPSRIVVAETYPAAYYRMLGIGFGRGESKRRRADRGLRAPRLLHWAEQAGLAVEPALRIQLEDGFESDDPFDATIGLFGMLGVLVGRTPSGEPRNDPSLAVEGWILGRHEGAAATSAPLTARAMPAASVGGSTHAVTRGVPASPSRVPPRSTPSPP